MHSRLITPHNSYEFPCTVVRTAPAPVPCPAPFVISACPFSTVGVTLGNDGTLMRRRWPVGSCGICVSDGCNVDRSSAAVPDPLKVRFQHMLELPRIRRILDQPGRQVWAMHPMTPYGRNFGVDGDVARTSASASHWANKATCLYRGGKERNPIGSKTSEHVGIVDGHETKRRGETTLTDAVRLPRRRGPRRLR